MEEMWDAMETLQRQGKIIYVGSSNFAGWDIATACMSAKMRNRQGLVSEQSVYNLDNRMVELEVIPSCRHFGVGIIPWSPLAGGLLSGALAKAREGRRGNANFQKRVDEKRDQLEQWEGLCADLGEEPATVAIAWLLHNPAVTAPIIGPRTMEQFKGNLKAIEVDLSEEVLGKIDAIWPGPGGEAPKAYAW